MKTMRTLALAVTTAAVLAACGGDDDGDVDTTETTTELTAPAAPTAPPDATPAAPEPTDTGVSSESTTDTVAAAEGFVFEGPDYTVTFPAEPETATQQAPTAVPDRMVDVVSHTALGADRGSFAVAEIDVPEDLPYSLDAGVDGAVQTVGGTLLDSREIELDGVPGREFVASISSNGVEGTYVSRVYSDQSRVWQLVVANAGSFDADDPAVVAFFDSFQFTEGG